MENMMEVGPVRQANNELTYSHTFLFGDPDPTIVAPKLGYYVEITRIIASLISTDVETPITQAKLSLFVGSTAFWESYIDVGVALAKDGGISLEFDIPIKSPLIGFDALKWTVSGLIQAGDNLALNLTGCLVKGDSFGVLPGGPSSG